MRLRSPRKLVVNQPPVVRLLFGGKFTTSFGGEFATSSGSPYNSEEETRKSVGVCVSE